MKLLASSFAQLAAIIIMLITLAVSTAAFSQWLSPDNSGNNAGDSKAQSQLVSAAR